MFISGDGDFCSQIYGDVFNSFLFSEWSEKKTSEINFYKSLSDFLKHKFPHIHLASDVKTAALVEQLAQSGSFATTHAVIASLSKVADFPNQQIEEFVSIAELNNQVDMGIAKGYAQQHKEAADLRTASSTGRDYENNVFIPIRTTDCGKSLITAPRWSWGYGGAV